MRFFILRLLVYYQGFSSRLCFDKLLGTQYNFISPYNNIKIDVLSKKGGRMKEFIAIDFETANPQRVSACALGYVKVFNREIVETKSYLIKPVGGHAPFQSKIHGIKEEHTYDKPEFGGLFPEIQDIFNYPLVANLLLKPVGNNLNERSPVIPDG